MHHLWARAHLTVLEIRFFGAVVVVVFASIFVVVYTLNFVRNRFRSENLEILSGLLSLNRGFYDCKDTI